MDILDLQATFFRRMPVHLQNGGADSSVFRPIPVQNAGCLKAVPLDTRSLAENAPIATGNFFPAHTRSFLKQADAALAAFFRPIPVHSVVVLRYLCTGRQERGILKLADDEFAVGVKLAAVTHRLPVKEIIEIGLAHRMITVDCRTIHAQCQTYLALAVALSA